MEDRELIKASKFGHEEAYEMSKIIGQPVDPRKPNSRLVDAICFTDSAAPEDYVYSHTLTSDTDKVYIITATGILTQENVTPRTPVLMNFIDLNTPEYYVKFIDVLKKKEDVYARIKRQITREMNAYENYKLLTLAEAAVQAGLTFGRSSNHSTFTFDVLIEMREALAPYGDKFVLVVGNNVNTDMLLWDYRENKFRSLAEQLAALNITIIPIYATEQVSIDGGGQTKVLDADNAFMFALRSQDDSVEKPVVWVRKKLDDIRNLAGVTAEDGGAPERIVFVSPNPVQVGSDRVWSIGSSGFEEFAAAVVNPFGIAFFNHDA